MAPHESNHTTHYSVMDAMATQSRDYDDQRLVRIAGHRRRLGFCSNDEMDDFFLQAGRANGDGLIRAARMRLARDSGPLSSMTPTIVCADGRTVMVLGRRAVPRSSRPWQCFNGCDGLRMNIQEAVNAPRFHNQWMPDVVKRRKMVFRPTR